MNEKQKARETISMAYGAAVSRPSGGGCCSGPVPMGEVTKFAGYRPEELEALPPGAVSHAFGCGHPLAFSEVGEGDVVLDLGSGAGIDLLIAARAVGPSGRVIGVDMTDEMIAKARENIAEAGFSNVEVRKGIIEDLPVASSSVDWLISNCVINLSPEKPRVFAEIARVLKPGGRMIVSDIVADDLPGWVLQDEVLYTSCVAGAISEAAYLDGLRRAGLVDVKVRGRVAYDAEQLRAFLRCDLAGTDPAVAGWVASQGEETLARTAESLAGRVCSVRVYARKPGR